jgi:hypothetical protein
MKMSLKPQVTQTTIDPQILKDMCLELLQLPIEVIAAKLAQFSLALFQKVEVT